MYSFKSCIVSCLTFKSFFYFEFIFVYGLKECSNFILLHATVWFSQHHLLKRLSFLPLYILAFIVIDSVQVNHSVMSDSLQLYGLQHARLPCPSPTPRAYSNSCPLSWRCHPTISSSVIPFSFCL